MVLFANPIHFARHSTVAVELLGRKQTIIITFENI